MSDSTNADRDRMATVLKALEAARGSLIDFIEVQKIRQRRGDGSFQSSIMRLDCEIAAIDVARDAVRGWEARLPRADEGAKR